MIYKDIVGGPKYIMEPHAKIHQRELNYWKENKKWNAEMLSIVPRRYLRVDRKTGMYHVAENYYSSGFCAAKDKIIKWLRDEGDEWFYNPDEMSNKEANELATVRKHSMYRLGGKTGMPYAEFYDIVSRWVIDGEPVGEAVQDVIDWCDGNFVDYEIGSAN